MTKAGAWLAAMHDRAPEPVDVAGLEYREVFSVTRANGGIALGAFWFVEVLEGMNLRSQTVTTSRAIGPGESRQ